MSEFSIFAFEEKVVRVHQDENGNPWFVAKDVCRVLGLDNSREAISGLDDDEKITVSNPDGNPRAGIPHQMALVSESGLYALIFRSRKPQAKAFSKWVRAEVLPSIRKTGSYTLPGVTAAQAGGVLADLPQDVLALAPKLRTRCYQLALQTLRVTGEEDAPSLRQTFIQLCRALGCKQQQDWAAEAALPDFLQECCERGPGSVTTRVLWPAYKNWCRKTGRGNPHGLSMKRFSQLCKENLAQFLSFERPFLNFRGLRLRDEFCGPAFSVAEAVRKEARHA